jgi:hypothetical protein
MDNDNSTPVMMMMISVCGSTVMMILVAIVAVFMIRGRKKKDANDGDQNDAAGDAVSTPGGYKNTTITFFGQGGPGGSDDNGKGITGISLYDYTGQTFNGKPLFPGAVHQKDGAAYLYKVIEVYCNKFKSPGNTVYLHVVDVCGKGDEDCINNIKKHNFLVDVHYNAFDYVGLDDGKFDGGFKVIGTIRPGKIPKNAWIQKVQDEKDSVLCSCSNDCTSSYMDWKTLSKCK